MTPSVDNETLVKNPIKLLQMYKDSGVNVIGYTCSYIPEELIISAGFQPFRIPNYGSTFSSLTPTFICQFARTTLENILKLEEFFSGFVFAHTCDPMWRLYDIIKKKVGKPVFFIRVPHNTDGILQISFLKRELLRFKDFLAENLGAKIDFEALLKAIKICNENRSLLKEIYLRNGDGAFGVNGLDRLKFAIASMWMPKEEVNAQIKTFLSKIGDVKENYVRLHINGTAIFDLELIKMIEDVGCFIASDDLCTGSRYFWDNVANFHQDPFYALAERYLQRTPCPSHGPLQKRLAYIESMVEKFRVKGVLILTQRFCDPILYDSVHVRDMLSKKQVPTMLIDYENFEQEAGRIKARVEAFVESIGG
jgi:benzoyl-CoA reductase/2-hydroxyglutaryl-CoA dehydratase subunit BcrC/BadD/HgdB